MDEKLYPKKLRSGATIMVSEQIARWRRERREREKAGVFLGRHSKKQREKVDKNTKRLKDEKAIKSGSKKFF